MFYFLSYKTLLVDNMEDDSFEEEILLLFLLRRRRKRRAKKQLNKQKRSAPRFWVRSIFKKRDQLGEYHRLVQELRYEDREYFFR